MNNIHAPLFLKGSADIGLVMFVHGFMGSPRQFDKLAGVAHRLGYSVAVLLLPGHGGSAKDFGAGTFERWQNHVDSEVERFSRDYKNIWLFGHSMGGLLAVNAAVKYSDNIRGLFLLASPFKIILISAHAVKVRLQLIFFRRNSPMKAAYLDGTSVKLTPNLLWHIFKPLAELNKLMKATRANLPNVRPPVTAVYSTSDELVSFHSLGILKSGLAGVGFEHFVLTDSLHAYYTEHEFSIIERAFIKMIAQ